MSTLLRRVRQPRKKLHNLIKTWFINAMTESVRFKLNDLAAIQLKCQDIRIFRLDMKND